MNSITIATNTFETYHRQDVAVQSWVHLRNTCENVSLMDIQFADESKQYYNQLTTCFYLDRSSKDVEPRSIKKLPILFDILEAAFVLTDDDYVVYTNSDVILLPRLIEYIQKESPDCMAGPRLDIEDIESFQDVLDNKVKPVRCEIAGYDYFVFERSWWMENKHHFDYPFVIGKPMFDVIYAGLIVMFGKKYRISNNYPMMALHIHHGLAAVTTDCPERDHNIRIAGSDPILKIADNIMFYNLQHNLCRREPWGAFINPKSDEQVKQKAFFDTMNIHTDNQIRHISNLY
jgi:hypothetical protein